jgi:hypothetical protein
MEQLIFDDTAVVVHNGGPFRADGLFDDGIINYDKLPIERWLIKWHNHFQLVHMFPVLAADCFGVILDTDTKDWIRSKRDDDDYYRVFIEDTVGQNHVVAIPHLSVWATPEDIMHMLPKDFEADWEPMRKHFRKLISKDNDGADRTAKKLIRL